MTTLTITLPSDVYERLRQRSEESGKSAQAVAEELLAERLSAAAATNNESPTVPPSERERAREVMRQAGLLRGPEPGSAERGAVVRTFIREHPEEWAAMSERERAIEVLRQSGMLTELSPAEKERAKRAKMTLEEIHAAFARSPGKPLSEIVIEQRGPKDWEPST